MYTSWKVSLISFVLLNSLIGNATDDDNESVSSDRMQGEWIVDSIQFADFTMSGTDEKPIRVSISGNTMSFRPRIDLSYHATFSFGTNGYGFRSSKTVTVVFTEGLQRTIFSLDDTKSPVQLDIQEEREKKTIRRHGVCRWKGEYLELSLASGVVARPLEFRSSKSTMVLQLKRLADKN